MSCPFSPQPRLWRSRIMKDYEPILSFGKEVAATMTIPPAGMKRRRSHSWSSWRGADRRWSWRSAPAASRCRWRREGIRVDGIDFSPAMVARLRAKPGGDQIAVTIGDFADVPVPGAYGLIYVVSTTRSSICSPRTTRCAVSRMSPRISPTTGVFVVEAFVPAYLHRLRDEQYVDAERSSWRGAVGRRSPRSRGATPRREPRRPVQRRACVVYSDRHPVRLAERARSDGAHRGLRLQHRWSGWEQRAIHRRSRRHVRSMGAERYARGC